MDRLSRDVDQPLGTSRGGPEAGGVVLCGRGGGTLAGASRSAAERGGDTRLARGQRDCLTSAGGRRLADAAARHASVADDVWLVSQLA